MRKSIKFLILALMISGFMFSSFVEAKDIKPAGGSQVGSYTGGPMGIGGVAGMAAGEQITPYILEYCGRDKLLERSKIINETKKECDKLKGKEKKACKKDYLKRVEAKPEFKKFENYRCTNYSKLVFTCMDNFTFEDKDKRFSCEEEAKNELNFNEDDFDGRLILELKEKGEVKVPKYNGSEVEENIEEPAEESMEDLESDTIEEDFDGLDHSSYNLQHGDLIAWGVPGVPRIPAPRKTTKTNASSNNTQQAPAAQEECKDPIFNNIKLIESNASKVTDTEKDQFLNELKSQN